MIDPFEGIAHTLRRFGLETDITSLEQRLHQLAAEGGDETAGVREVLVSRLAHRRAELADLGD